MSVDNLQGTSSQTGRRLLSYLLATGAVLGSGEVASGEIVVFPVNERLDAEELGEMFEIDDGPQGNIWVDSLPLDLNADGQADVVLLDVLGRYLENPPFEGRQIRAVTALTGDFDVSSLAEGLADYGVSLAVPGPGSVVLEPFEAYSELTEEDYSGIGIASLEPGFLIGQPLPPGFQLSDEAQDKGDLKLLFNGQYFEYDIDKEEVELYPEDKDGFGPWVNKAEECLGVRFEIDGQQHFGFARMSHNADGSFTVHQVGYETEPGVPIVCGQLGVPDKTLLPVETDKKNPLDIEIVNPLDFDFRLEVVDGPEHGEIRLSSREELVYVSDSGYEGPDSFTFRAVNLDNGVATGESLVVLEVSLKGQGEVRTLDKDSDEDCSLVPKGGNPLDILPLAALALGAMGVRSLRRRRRERLEAEDSENEAS